MTVLKLNYHYGNEAEQYSFYRIPKILFTDERFKSLSIDAKMLYGLMLDRMGLSVKNNWFDGENRVYIYFTLEDACAFMGQSQSKMVRIMAELDDKKGIGLIERKKQGQGKPTIIYVKNFSSLVLKKDRSPKTVLKKHSKPNFIAEDKTSHNDKSEQENIDETGIIQPLPVDASVDKCDSTGDFSRVTYESKMQTTEYESSSLNKKGSQDFSKWNTNNTKINNTDLSDTDSINLSKERQTQKEDLTSSAFLMDRMDERKLYSEIIKENIGYNHFAEKKPYDTDEIDGIVELMLDIVCSNAQTTRIAGQDIPTTVVKSRFLKLDSSHIEYVFDSLSKNTTKINNIKAYLLTSLYNAPVTMSSYYSALVNHDLYGK
ncbi:DUF6017 domain-containing protein [Anaerotignum propionicum]|uniref:Replication initiator protein A (RepA) N-terminus n=1 Tax=Anaerotignum propionicum DSM 1682 TaxID=991789 RepID=A0A0X1U962_ANAPI|nr:DUF6017 domain-containing protein [Anaerotignum propionicum]AMJ41476.1 hypothetical protein CPRO_18940 [Anaerotignum propionicum DSM 1682]SHE69434.1 Replication initiator protein A (RepA) N-terminus [[Clostridium] propionicum DSM 1682] [Anaerotignum propionicum DSM 1682]